MAAETYLRESGGWRNLRDGSMVGGPPAGSPAFAGDPGDGNYYVSWANGPGAGGAGSLSTGNSWSLNKISVYHEYSTATNGTVSSSVIDSAMSNDVISSQSFKLNATNAAGILAGNCDAQITAAANACMAPEPWPIWLCYFHEPGGNFGTVTNGGTATTMLNYRSAFRYIIQRFRNEGAGSNINWQCILEAPYDFRPAISGGPGGARNYPSGCDWRHLHPDYNGGTTGTRADWHDDLVLDTFGLDIYNPLVNGSSFQDYDDIWDDVEWQWETKGFPIDEYGGVNIMEMGWSDIIDPDPNWNTYATRVLARQAMHNIKCFTYWDNNNDSPRRYAFTAASDANGDKLSGWQTIASGATIWTP